MDGSLEQELQDTAATCARLARRNYVWAHLVFAVAVIASFAASILAASQAASPALVAAVAALPALALMVNNTLRFEERTRWLWRKARMAEKYLRRLRDARDPLRDALSAEFSSEAEQLESEWPAFGSSPVQPKANGAGR